MSDDTPYGTLTVQGVDVATTSDLDLDSGRTQMPGLRLWGHRIILDGDDGVSCEECDMSEEVPDLLQMSSGFREVVYKLYILGKFKNTRCEPEYETDQSVLHTRTTNTSDTDTVQFQTGGQYRIDVGDGEVVTDGNVIYQSTSSDYHAGDMLTHRESLELQAEWEDQQKQSSMKDMADSFSSLSDTMGDMQMMTSPQTHKDLQRDAGLDTGSATNTSVQMDADVDDKSAKEKFAAALCEKAGIR